MKKITLGILAHVDSGKTTLSEALLFKCGTIRSLGRVDTKDCYLDNNSIERSRGITIFSKQARLSTASGKEFVLIDTPGHVDFSAEMERTLSVLDAAILLINAVDGIQAHTKTVWSLLKRNNIPVIIFVNKMDMCTRTKDELLLEIKNGLSEDAAVFSNTERESFFETAASSSEELMETFLGGGKLSNEQAAQAFSNRSVFPCIFGSALKVTGIEDLICYLDEYTFSKKDLLQSENKTGSNNTPSCIVYKITYDKQNNRLTHLKVTDGILHAKDFLGEEKVNEIRLYNGEKYESVKEAAAGEICCVTGLRLSKAGTTYGNTETVSSPQMESALIYAVHHPSEIDLTRMLKILRELEEELPELKVEFNESAQEIRVMLMGEVQTEVIKQLIHDRYSIDIQFGEGRIAYRETITEPVRGTGHYEPLKHYAEVQLELMPLPRGSGNRFNCNLSVDVLDTNWQRLILTHLNEKQHVGILTGSPITDIEINVLAGRDHLKHTEGGDFRQATYRAVRNALMYSKSVLLEPFYNYEIVVPETCTGRVMSDMQRKSATCNIVENKNGFAVLTGRVPVSEMTDYINEIRSFSKGQGTLSMTLCGYDLCHNEKEVIEKINYNADTDKENPASSVFCSHGAGFVVPWNEVVNYKHISI